MDFVHEATVKLANDADPRALGGAITVALCGHWDHEPPCRWPHHTDVSVAADHHAVRTSFTADPSDETEVRRRIVEALEAESLTGPDGRQSRWTVARAS